MKKIFFKLCRSRKHKNRLTSFLVTRSQSSSVSSNDMLSKDAVLPCLLGKIENYEIAWIQRSTNKIQFVVEQIKCIEQTSSDGISKAKLSLNTGLSVCFLTCVFFFAIRWPLCNKYIFTYGSARPVTSILGRFRAFNRTTVRRAAPGCQHNDINSSPRPCVRIWQCCLGKGNFRRYLAFYTDILYAECEEFLITLMLLGWISLLNAICCVSIWFKSMPFNGNMTSPMMSSREYRSKLNTTKWRDIADNSAKDKP